MIIPSSPQQNNGISPMKQGKVQQNKEDKDWTVLIYFNGNNNIEGDILTGFLTAEEISDNKKMNMLAQLGRAPQSIAHNSYKDEVDGDWDGVRRYVVKKGETTPYDPQVWTSMGKHDKKIDSEIAADLGKADMSNPEVLKDFLKWGMEKYPAKHYMVVLAGHGSGFLGSLPDYKSRKHMGLSETARVFDEVKKETGVKPDVLVMDACLMAQAEAIHELKDTAEYYVASEDYNYSCFPLQKTFEVANEMMETGLGINPREMTALLVDKAGEHNNISTVSSVDLSKVDKFSKTMKGLADAFLATNTDPVVIRDVVRSTRGFAAGERKVKPYSDFKDLKDLAAQLMIDTRITDEKLKDAAADLVVMLNDNFIPYENHDKKYDNNGDREVYGLSVYFPTDGFNYDDWESIYPENTNKGEYEAIYRSLSFARETGWDKVIEKFSEKKKPEIKGNDVINMLLKGKFKAQ